MSKITKNFNLNNNLTHDKSKIFRHNRLIYSIEFNITSEDIQQILLKGNIDFFLIVTNSFTNVNDYYCIIKEIKRLSRELKVQVGIIAELRGRKITVENFKSESLSIHLKQNDIVKIIPLSCDPRHNSQLVTDGQTIIVNFNQLDNLVKVNDNIILDDSRGLLTVLDIKENLGSPDVNRYVELGKRHLTATSVNKCPSSTILQHRSKPEHSPVHSQDSLGDIKETYNIGLKGVNKLRLSQKGLANVRSLENLPYDFSPKKIFSFPEHSGTKDNFENLYEDADIAFDCDDELKSQQRTSFIDNFIRKHARRSTVGLSESKDSNSHIPSPGESLISPRKFRQFLMTKSQINQKYEIICKVNFDCQLNKNSTLFVPNADFKDLNLDLLSNREVAEICKLDEMEVDFISISISDAGDIQSIIGESGVLSNESKLKIIATIPDYRVR